MTSIIVKETFILGLQPRDKRAMLVSIQKNTFFVELVMKMEFSPQRGEKCFCSWSIKCCFGHWLLAIGNLVYGTDCHDLLV